MWKSQPEIIDYLIIGRTKTSAMMADALVRKGKKCELVTYPEWRVTQPFVTKMVTDLAAAMASRRSKVIIVAGLDESYYLAQYEEVHTSPARKDAAGHYHIDGDLIVAAKAAQLRLLNILEPVWEQTEGTKKVVVGPMMRYITEGCCDDSNHIPNRKDPGFSEKLKKELLEARNVLKDYFQKEGHNHCRVLDPAVDIAGDGEATGQTGGTGTRSGIVIRTGTGKSITVAAATAAAEGAHPEETGASGHRPSPEDEPGAAEVINIED
jgi:hypothetical protein